MTTRSDRAMCGRRASNQSGYMGVVSHSYGALSGGGRDKVDGWYAFGTMSGEVCLMSGDAKALSMCKVNTLMAPNLTSFMVRSSR